MYIQKASNDVSYLDNRWTIYNKGNDEKFYTKEYFWK